MKKLAYLAALVAVAMGCDQPPETKQEPTRAEAWHGAMTRLEPARPPSAPPPMTPVEADPQRVQQAIGWWGGDYSWGYCNRAGWPSCGSGGSGTPTGYIVFYRGSSGNYTGEGIQFWTTGAGNNDVWMDLDYYTWPDGTNVNNTAKSMWMFRGPSTWDQKAYLCEALACGGGGVIEEFYTFAAYHPEGTGDAWITYGLSSFWFIADY
jgi:hypothetical protein